MKTFYRILVLATILLSNIVAPSTLMAQRKTSPQNSDLKITSWNSLKGVPLGLMVYGLYDNGNRVNQFFPSDQGFTEGEILTTDFGDLTWWKIVKGNRQMDIKFKARVDGLMLYTSSPEEDITWIKILEVWESDKKYFLYTVDNRNTYRVHLIDTDTMNARRDRELFLEGFLNGLNLN